ncbi:DUF2065 domain-containing protein [Thaumasiovibrio subtropicus]|uniref:DUF2065 domain-containing protein n=1 Tax=Thaumasiovibrio subtropicus TaxID=1891207 RepID=UPI000B34D381|nr:DUF2065 domain-containing protein [Thaumasiovibrio subtropicus]
MKAFWIAIGLVLILEGLGPMLAPRGWRAMMAEISRFDNNQLRRVGGCLVVAGLVIVYTIIG